MEDSSIHRFQTKGIRILVPDAPFIKLDNGAYFSNVDTQDINWIGLVDNVEVVFRLNKELFNELIDYGSDKLMIR